MELSLEIDNQIELKQSAQALGTLHLATKSKEKYGNNRTAEILEIRSDEENNDFDPIVEEPKINGSGQAIQIVDDRQDFTIPKDENDFLDEIASVAEKLEKCEWANMSKKTIDLTPRFGYFL